MATGRGNKLTGQVGEFLVCAELGRIGLIATPFSGNVPDFDVIATDEDCRSVPIQVKTSNGQTSWQFSAGKYLDIEYDEKTHKQKVLGILGPTYPGLIFVFVWLHRKPGEPDRFFLLTQVALLNLMKDAYTAYLAKHDGRRPVRPESRHLALRNHILEPFENNWKLVEEQLRATDRRRESKS